MSFAKKLAKWTAVGFACGFVGEIGCYIALPMYEVRLDPVDPVKQKRRAVVMAKPAWTFLPNYAERTLDLKTNETTDKLDVRHAMPGYPSLQSVMDGVMGATHSTSALAQALAKLDRDSLEYKMLDESRREREALQKQAAVEPGPDTSALWGDPWSLGARYVVRKS